MASRVIRALFTAQENLSNSLNDIKQSATETQGGISSLETTLTRFENLTDASESQTEEFRNALFTLKEATEQSDRSVEEFARTMMEFQANEISSEEATERLEDAVSKLSASSNIADNAISGLESELKELVSQGVVSDQWAENFQESLNDIGSASIQGSSGVSLLNRTLNLEARAAENAERSTEGYGKALAALNGVVIPADIGNQRLQSSMDEVGDEAEEASRKVRTLAADLGVLSAVANSSALSVGSLSINIGPFNVALRNLATQLPIILSGMGTLLALVLSLAGAFVVLGGALAGLFAGGAIAFFDEFSKQFEESSEAVEALMGALKDLFKEALAPLTTEANADLFVDTINAMARVVNRFAQFVAQMRGDILSFIGGISADMDSMFEAMHDSFAILRPILKEFIEFFLNEFPVIMLRFAELTDSVSGDIGLMVVSVGQLLDELLKLTDTLLTVLAPAIAIVLGSLETFFTLVNFFNDRVVQLVAAISLLGLAIAGLISKLAGLISWIVGVNAAMVAQVGSGSLLGFTYASMTAAAQMYTAGQISMWGAIKKVSAAVNAQIGALLRAKVTKAQDALVTQFLTTAYQNLVAWIKKSIVYQKLSAIWSRAAAAAKWILATASLGLISALFGEAAAATVSTTVLGAYTAVASAAAGATSVLTVSIYGLTVPIWGTVVAVGALVAALAALINWITGGKISEVLGGLFGGIISRIKEFIGWVKELIGLGGVLGGGGGMSVTDTDDIQTASNVDLSFEDNLEQNMEVNADPEEKEQMKRVVKDALNEANATARRQEGMGR